MSGILCCLTSISLRLFGQVFPTSLLLRSPWTPWGTGWRRTRTRWVLFTSDLIKLHLWYSLKSTVEQYYSNSITHASFDQFVMRIQLKGNLVRIRTLNGLVALQIGQCFKQCDAKENAHVVIKFKWMDSLIYLNEFVPNSFVDTVEYTTAQCYRLTESIKYPFVTPICFPIVWPSRRQPEAVSMLVRTHSFCWFVFLLNVLNRIIPHYKRHNPVSAYEAILGLLPRAEGMPE